jgi:transcriptional regulator with XRE-family HTH domain
MAKATFARFETMQRVLQTLKAARVQQGLSLADVDERTGMGKGNLSRLENDPAANPTLETLLRLAEAIGVELRLAVVDKKRGKVIDTSAA